MILLFLRHADAEAQTGSDYARQLTPKGHDQSAKVGNFLQQKGLRPEVVLASPVTRALQTARIVSNLVQVPYSVCPWLACGMDVETLLEEMPAFLDMACILLVGHEPDIGNAVSSLVGMASSDAVKIRKASLTALAIESAKKGSAQLQFSIPVRLMC